MRSCEHVEGLECVNGGWDCKCGGRECVEGSECVNGGVSVQMKGVHEWGVGV